MTEPAASTCMRRRASGGGGGAQLVENRDDIQDDAGEVERIDEAVEPDVGVSLQWPNSGAAKFSMANMAQMRRKQAAAGRG